MPSAISARGVETCKTDPALNASQIEQLAKATKSYLQAIDSPVLGRMLSAWPAGYHNLRSIEPNALPVLSHLSDALAVATAHSACLLTALNAISASLAWRQTYSAHEMSDYFIDRYGWTELMGERGPIANNQIACGFLLLGPKVEYPRHAHEAEEIYIPLTRGSLWQWQDDGWENRPADEPIYHASWMPHAMRTEDKPLLALYLWRAGDLTQKSIFE